MYKIDVSRIIAKSKPIERCEHFQVAVKFCLGDPSIFSNVMVDEFRREVEIVEEKSPITVPCHIESLFPFGCNIRFAVTALYNLVTCEAEVIFTTGMDSKLFI